MIRVLVAARSPVVRAGLESVLAGAGGYEVARSGVLPSALADQAAAFAADVLVLELGADDDLPVPLGGDAEAALRAPAVVLLADRPGAAWVAEALRAGALAVLPRDARPEEITAAVDAAAAGLVVLPAALAGELAARAAAEAPAADPLPPPADPGLTPREREVLELLARGMGNKGVARALGISEHTVKAHVGAVFEKLGASTRTEAVTIGVRTGLLLL